MSINKIKSLRLLLLGLIIGSVFGPILINRFALQQKITKVAAYKIFSINSIFNKKNYPKHVIQAESYKRSAYGEIEEEKINFNNYETGFIIMDPWDNHSIESINEEIKLVTRTKLIPLVKSLRNKNYPVIVVTNKCINKNNLSCGLDNNLMKIEGIITYYHNYETSRSFGIKLKKMGIDKLIYAGYSSNGCLLGARQMSIIPMYHEGFSTSFIPEASLAIEIKETRNKKTLHESTITIISQWLGSILDYKSIMNSLE